MVVLRRDRGVREVAVRTTVGIDIELIERFGPGSHTLFTAAEWHQIASAAPESIAGRWCAKEAVVKAVSAVRRISTRNVEVLTGPDGRPVASLHRVDLGETPRVDVTISHAGGTAVAVAVCVWE